MSKHDWKAILAIGCIGCVALSIISYMALKSQEVRTEQIAIEEREATERTEERSQFWQKLIPWGSDESEDGQGTPDPETAG